MLPGRHGATGMTVDVPPGAQHFSPPLLLVLRLTRIAIGSVTASQPFAPAPPGFDWNLFEAEVTVVLVSVSGKPLRLGAMLREAIGG